MIVVGTSLFLSGLVVFTRTTLEKLAERDRRPGAVRQDDARLAGEITGAALFGPFYGFVVLLGGIKMYRLREYRSAQLVSVLAMLPCSPCCLIGLPIGIWSLKVLNDPAVKATFR